jgi:hypothetical protein
MTSAKSSSNCVDVRDVDIDQITDEIDRQATESHIQNFGQTPSQLLTKEPHPRRLSPDDCWKPMIYDVRVTKRMSKEIARVLTSYVVSSNQGVGGEAPAIYNSAKTVWIY